MCGMHSLLHDQCPKSCFPAGGVDDKNVPTLVQKLVGHKIIDVDCGSDDAHTLALDSNGQWNIISVRWNNTVLRLLERVGVVLGRRWFWKTGLWKY